MMLIFLLSPNGYIAEKHFCKCDPLFTESAAFKNAKAQWRKERHGPVTHRYTLDDFDYDLLLEPCRCPTYV